LFVAKPARSSSTRAFVHERSSQPASLANQKAFEDLKLLSNATSVRESTGSQPGNSTSSSLQARMRARLGRGLAKLPELNFGGASTFLCRASARQDGR
jgi:hypothetical protein